jgi:hypothetical protein
VFEEPAFTYERRRRGRDRRAAGLVAVLALQCSAPTWAVRPIAFGLRQPPAFDSLDAYEAFYEIDGYQLLLSPSPDMAGATILDSADLPDSVLDEFGLPRIGEDGIAWVTVEGSDADLYAAARAYNLAGLSPLSNVGFHPADGVSPPPDPSPDPTPAPVPEPPGPEGDVLREIIDGYEGLSELVLDLERDFRAHVSAARTQEEYLGGYATIFEARILPRLGALDLDAYRDRPALSKRDREAYRTLARYERKVKKLGALLRVRSRRAELDPATKERLLQTLSRRATELMASIDRRIAQHEQQLHQIP